MCCLKTSQASSSVACPREVSSPNHSINCQRDLNQINHEALELKPLIRNQDGELKQVKSNVLTGSKRGSDVRKSIRQMTFFGSYLVPKL